MKKKYAVIIGLMGCCLLAEGCSFSAAQNEQVDYVTSEIGGMAPVSESDEDSGGHEFYTNPDDIINQVKEDNL